MIFLYILSQKASQLYRRDCCIGEQIKYWLTLPPGGAGRQQISEAAADDLQQGPFFLSHFHTSYKASENSISHNFIQPQTKLLAICYCSILVFNCFTNLHVRVRACVCVSEAVQWRVWLRLWACSPLRPCSSVCCFCIVYFVYVDASVYSLETVKHGACPWKRSLWADTFSLFKLFGWNQGAVSSSTGGALELGQNVYSTM